MSQAAWNDLMNDGRRIADARNKRDEDRAHSDAAARYQALIDQLQARVIEAENDVCGGFAIQTALEVFVARCYPDHALLKDGDLRARIFKAGVSAGNLENSYGAARQAARTFAMPPEVWAPLLTTEATIKALGDRMLLLETQLEAAQAEAAALRVALSQAHLQVTEQDARNARTIRDCAYRVAQGAAYLEQLRQVDPSNPLVMDAQLRQDIAVAGYEELVRNQGQSWEKVKDVGRNFPIRHAGASMFLSAEDLVEQQAEAEQASRTPSEGSAHSDDAPEHLMVQGAGDEPERGHADAMSEDVSSADLVS